MLWYPPPPQHNGYASRAPALLPVLAASFILVALAGALLAILQPQAEAQALARVSRISFSAPLSGDTYTLGETIEVFVSLHPSSSIIDTRYWQLPLRVGTATRTLLAPSRANSGDRVFRYTVQVGDVDADGVRVDRNSILDRFDRPIRHDAASGEYGVNGDIAVAPRITYIGIVSSPRSDGVYTLGESIRIGIQFDKRVRIRGSSQPGPQLTLNVGSATRQAAQSSQPLEAFLAGADGRFLAADARPPGRGTTMHFEYVVQPDDKDTNFNLFAGVAADALNPNGWRIVLADNATEANPDLSGALAAHRESAEDTRIDGGAVHSPEVSRLSVGGDGAYAAADARGGASYTFPLASVVTVTVEFDSGIALKDVPRLELLVGTAERRARFVAASDSSLLFRYAVQREDRGEISIPAGSLRGAVVSAVDGATPANLNLPGEISGGSRWYVDGPSWPGFPRLRGPRSGIGHGIQFTEPANGSTYARGEVIRVLVRFMTGDSRYNVPAPVAVSGAPRLALTIGTETRYADYLFHAGPTVAFGYAVQASDRDANGIAVPAGPINLNGGTIALRADDSVAASLSSYWALADDPRLKVDGRIAPPARATDGAADGAAGGAAAAAAEVRINARRLADGRIEFGLQERDGNVWGDRILPSQRFFPAAGGTRWLSSSPIEVGGD